MNMFLTPSSINSRASGRQLCWYVLVLFVLLSGYTMMHHEPWGDELHSWNIAKGSHSFYDLIRNTRYEGHPPGWYTVLWAISKFSHRLIYMQLAQWILSCLVVFMMLFCSPMPLLTKMMIPFGYYFAFEYAILSRNYVLGVLLGCCICYIMRKDFKYKQLLYYVLLCCMSNIHLLAAILAASLHVYFLLFNMEQKNKNNTIAKHLLLGFAVLLPALYFIYPPSDGQLNMHFWMSNWSLHQIITFGQVPLRAFIPMQAWWTDQCWNTEFLLEVKNAHPILKLLNLLISAGILAMAAFVLKKNMKCLALFGTNLLLSFGIAVVVFPLTTARYAGFVFIGFIFSYWLYCYESPVNKINMILVNILLSLQMLAAAFMISKDARLPFSNLYRIEHMIREVPPGGRLVTDYWTMNAMVAYTDQPVYCVDMGKDLSFILWAGDLAVLQKNPYRYTTGIKNLFQRENIRSVYMISAASPDALQKTDPRLSADFRLVLVDKTVGAIEKGSNLYLYQISDRL